MKLTNIKILTFFATKKELPVAKKLNINLYDYGQCLEMLNVKPKP